MVVVLILASGAAWESAALTRLEHEPGVVVLRRCVDVPDLLAAASAGQADVAVVALEAPGLDLAAVDHLRRFQVRPVAVVPSGPGEQHALRAARLGITATVADDDLDELPDGRADRGLRRRGRHRRARAARLRAADDRRRPGRRRLGSGRRARDGPRWRWRWPPSWPRADGVRRSSTPTPTAAPSPSSSASSTRSPACSPRPGWRARGGLEARFGSVQRAVGDHLTVVTGLPRADRWVEVRRGVVEHLLEVAAAHGDVVVDTGFSLEADPAGEFGARPPRNQLTLAALAEADEVVVVGSADPVGLSRLARGPGRACAR